MSITAAQGFRAAGVAAGIKASGRLDLALVVNQGPRFDAAGVFTSNRVFAAPVAWSRQALADGRLQAVVLNSGGANACTGREGYQDTVATAHRVASAVGCDPEAVGVCSTGLIGVRLPMEALLAGVDQAHLVLADDGGDDAARAISAAHKAALPPPITRPTSAPASRASMISRAMRVITVGSMP